MRYFVPLYALGALVLARGAASVAPAVRRGLLAAHGLLGLALVVVFNCAPAHRAAEPWIPELQVSWIGVPLSLLDNLRMPLHLDQAAVLDNIDARVPPGATLYMLDVNYYRDAQQGVYERAGLIRPDITTVYASARDFHPEQRIFYVWRAAPPPAVAELEDLGLGLWRARRTG
jgi:hypothetical protein